MALDVEKEIGKLISNVDNFWRKNLAPSKQPSTEIVHGRKYVIVNFHLHGIDRKKVFLVVDDDKITVEAEKKLKKRLRRSEYESAERFFRSVALPVGLNIENAKHRWKGNTLTIEIPKKRKLI